MDKLNYFNLDKVIGYYIAASSNPKLLKTKRFIISSDLEKLSEFEVSYNEDSIKKVFENVGMGRKIRILPEFFKILDEENAGMLTKLLDSLRNILSLMYIADRYVEEKSCIEISLEGFQFHKQQINETSEGIESSSYYNIYLWVYENNNIVDKLGLVRNILSYNSPFEFKGIDKSVYNTIISNYKLYLRKNVEKYLEAKDKVVQNSLEMSTSLTQVLDQFVEEFKKIVFFLSTFFMTAFIMIAIAGGKLRGFANGDLLILSCGVIVLSFIYFIFAISSFNSKKKKLEGEYEDFKKGYEDIFDKHDIKNIFSEDKIFNRNIKYSKKIRKRIAGFSTIILIVLIGVIFLIRRTSSTEIVRENEVVPKIEEEKQISKVSVEMNVLFGKLNNFLPQDKLTIDEIKEVQSLLNTILKDTNLAIDGKIGPQSETAIKRYERDNNLEITGKATFALYERLKGEK